jgi:hypothetical protein
VARLELVVVLRRLEHLEQTVLLVLVEQVVEVVEVRYLVPMTHRVLTEEMVEKLVAAVVVVESPQGRVLEVEVETVVQGRL